MPRLLEYEVAHCLYQANRSEPKLLVQTIERTACIAKKNMNGPSKGSAMG